MTCSRLTDKFYPADQVRAADTAWVTHLVRRMWQCRRYAADPRNAPEQLPFWDCKFDTLHSILTDWVLERHLLNEERSTT